MNWITGEPMSGISVFFVSGAVISVGLGLITGMTGLFIPVFLVFFAGALVFRTVDRRNHSAGLRERFDRNAKKHPDVFDAPAATASSKKLPEQDSFSIYDNETADCLGTLTYPQLKSLIEKHEGWGLKSNDFYIMAETITKLEEEDADSGLIEFLRKALGGRDAMEIRWDS